jgi:hypothetical protein
LRRSRVDLLRGTVTVGEIVVEVQGVLHVGPPKTRAGLRTVGLPRFSRYGHLYPEADSALRDRLDALYGSAQPVPASPVVRLPRRAGRGPSVAPGASGDDESVADDGSATL